MKSKINICAGLVLVSLSLNGCATIIEGAHDKMYVQSAPVSGAFCKIYNEEGTYYVTTPGMITVSKSGHGLHATCAKDGFEESNQFISSHFQPVTLGNIVIGGAIGFGVDASSGDRKSVV